MAKVKYNIKILYTNMSLDDFMRLGLDSNPMRFECLVKSRWYDPNPIHENLLKKIYRETDGLYYFDTENGMLASHTMREIANKLDSLNKDWPKNSLKST